MARLSYQATSFGTEFPLRYGAKFPLTTMTKQSAGTRFVVADELLVLLLIRMVQDMASKIGERLLSSLIVLDVCLWYLSKSLIYFGYQLDHFP